MSNLFFVDYSGIASNGWEKLATNINTHLANHAAQPSASAASESPAPIMIEVPIIR